MPARDKVLIVTDAGASCPMTLRIDIRSPASLISMDYDFFARGIQLIFYNSFKRQLAVFLGVRSAKDVMSKSKLLYKEIVQISRW